MKTDKISITFNDKEKSFFMQDLTDTYNETCAFNKNKRGYEKFKNNITSAINAGDQSTFWKWIEVANTIYKLNTHTYCAMD